MITAFTIYMYVNNFACIRTHIDVYCINMHGTYIVINCKSIGICRQTQVAFNEKRNVWLDMKETTPGEWTSSEGGTLRQPIDW